MTAESATGTTGQLKVRPVEHLHQVGRDYPGAWAAYTQFVQERESLGGWPEWCYCPLAAAYAVASGGASRPVIGAADDVGRIGALAAWRATQGVYRFEPELLAELVETPIQGDLPAQCLERLPEWCVYVALDGAVMGEGLHGFFAHLEHDANNGRKELRFLLDCEVGLAPAVVHLGEGSLLDGLRAATVESRIQALRAGLAEMAPGVDSMTPLANLLGRLTALLLYLCSDAPELEDRAGRESAPRRPTLKAGKKGAHYPLPKRPIQWTVGVELARKLRQVQKGEGHVRGHVRRAHWHTYWVGRRSQPERRRRKLQWQHPILVNLDGAAPEAREREVGRDGDD